MSARWGLDGRDIKSAVRHIALPLVAGAGIAALQTIQAGALSLDTMKAATVTSLVAGVIRLLQRCVSEITPK